MEDAREEEIPHLVRPEKKTRMDGETPPHSPEQAAAVSKVLEDDNLLIEILIRLGFPTTLVRAALVCKRWLGHASDPKFLSCFRKLHPPRLLGYYISEGSHCRQWPYAPYFVPSLHQPKELAAVIRRLENYNFGAHEIMHCQNGSVFTKRTEERTLTHVVHRPLCAEKGMQIVPPLPIAPDGIRRKFSGIVSKEDGSDLSYLYVLGESTQKPGNSLVRVYMLQDGVWRMLTSATCLHAPRLGRKALHVDNKIYMRDASGDKIAVLDLTASSFSTIHLPQGVTYRPWKSMLSRADDTSSIYLIHVEGVQLQVWLHKGDNWLLVGNICLPEMLATLGISGHILESQGIANVLLRQVGNNGQFVFLQMGLCIFYLDIKCRTMCKVHENTRNGLWVDSVHPFMMIWPPTFPSIKDNPARFAYRLLEDIYSALVKDTKCCTVHDPSLFVIATS